MSLDLNQLTSEALQLPPASRALLAEQLVESLASAGSPELWHEWTSEAIRRREEIRTGAVKPLDGDEVLAHARRMVGR